MSIFGTNETNLMSTINPFVIKTISDGQTIHQIFYYPLNIFSKFDEMKLTIENSQLIASIRSHQHEDVFKWNQNFMFRFCILSTQQREILSENATKLRAFPKVKFFETHLFRTGDWKRYFARTVWNSHHGITDVWKRCLNFIEKRNASVWIRLSSPKFQYRQFSVKTLLQTHNFLFGFIGMKTHFLQTCSCRRGQRFICQQYFKIELWSNFRVSIHITNSLSAIMNYRSPP